MERTLEESGVSTKRKWKVQPEKKRKASQTHTCPDNQPTRPISQAGLLLSKSSKPDRFRQGGATNRIDSDRGGATNRIDSDRGGERTLGESGVSTKRKWKVQPEKIENTFGHPGVAFGFALYTLHFVILLFIF